MSRSTNLHDNADRFAQDVDALHAGRPAAETNDDADRADLALAHLLSRGQFVPTPRFESRLRSRLLNLLSHTQEETTMKSKFKLQSLLRPALVAGVSAVLLFAILTIVSPEVRAATLGWLTQFVEVDSPQALQPSIDKPAGVSAAGEAATINPEATSTTGLPKPDSLKISGQSAELPVPDAQPSRELISVEAAQAEVDFKIGVPSTLPAGYSVLGVVPKPKASDLKVQPPADLPKADLPKAAQLQVATLIMSNSAGDMLTLSEARMTSSVPADVSLPAGKGSVQNVTINGQSGQYVEGMWTDKGWVATGLHQLHWQDANGITFDLISSKLGLNDLLAIAESIQ